MKKNATKIEEPMGPLTAELHKLATLLSPGISAQDLGGGNIEDYAAVCHALGHRVEASTDLRFEGLELERWRGRQVRRVNPPRVALARRGTNPTMFLIADVGAFSQGFGTRVTPYGFAEVYPHKPGSEPRQPRKIDLDGRAYLDRSILARIDQLWAEEPISDAEMEGNIDDPCVP